MFAALINPLAIIVSLSTATGVFVHDTKIDKATLAALTSPVVSAAYESSVKQANIQPDLHTHAERNSLTQAVHDLKTQHPRIQPRGNEDKKHLLPKSVFRGHHSFDGYNLPIV
jgi:hypothetical protein